MSIVAKLVSIIGALLFLGIAFVVSAAVIHYMTWNPPVRNPTGATGLNESKPAHQWK